MKYGVIVLTRFSKAQELLQRLPRDRENGISADAFEAEFRRLSRQLGVELLIQLNDELVQKARAKPGANLESEPLEAVVENIQSAYRGRVYLQRDGKYYPI